MSATSSKKDIQQRGSDSEETQMKSKKWKIKRKLSCPSMEDIPQLKKHKKQKKLSHNYHLYKSLHRTRNSYYDSGIHDKLVIGSKTTWKKIKPQFKEKVTKAMDGYSSRVWRNISKSNLESKCWINNLPQEILLKIFGYLPLGMLLHIIPQVCKKWEALALDWTLWKTVEDLTIKNMVISTSKLKSLLRTIPKLKKLELILRNDTEELLHELFENHQNLEVLKLDRCYRSTLQMNIQSQTVTSILEFCPKLKIVMLTDTYFHSKNFYKCLAKKFRTIERINVTCTSKSEMNVFMENLKENVSEVEFQRVPMMGRAEGKQIYWGPILGLVVRPIPTSPFHQQYIHDNYPNYAF